MAAVHALEWVLEQVTRAEKSAVLPWQRGGSIHAHVRLAC